MYTTRRENTGYVRFLSMRALSSVCASLAHHTTRRISERYKMAPRTSRYSLDEVVDDSEPEREHCRQEELKKLNELRTPPLCSQVDVIIVITDDEDPGIIDLSGFWRHFTYSAITNGNRY